MATPKKTKSNRNGTPSRTKPTIRELQARIKELEKERDGYLSAVKALLPKKKPRITRKELREAEANPIPFDQMIEEVIQRMEKRRGR